MFPSIKLKIQNYILEKKVKKKRYKSNLITLSDVRKIGIVFDAPLSKDVVKVKDLLKYFLRKNIDVDVLGFVEKKKMEDFHLSTLHFNYINLKDLSFWGVPNSTVVERFFSKEFDMLINLSLSNSFCTKYVTLNSKSKFRVGVFSQNNKLRYDLMFNLKIKSLDFFIKNVIYYLEMIDKNNEK
tara:strand:+ start:217 stop:765 length:549 start_codon:yes stop_codon:yes gene_type:complete